MRNSNIKTGFKNNGGRQTGSS